MVLLAQFLYCNTHTLVEPCLISDIWQQKCPVIKSEYVILIMTKLIHGNNYYDEKVKNMLYKCKRKDDDGGGEMGGEIIGHILFSFFFWFEGGEYWEGRAVEWVGLGRESIGR